MSQSNRRESPLLYRHEGYWYVATSETGDWILIDSEDLSNYFDFSDDELRLLGSIVHDPKMEYLDLLIAIFVAPILERAQAMIIRGGSDVESGGDDYQVTVSETQGPESQEIDEECDYDNDYKTAAHKTDPVIDIDSDRVFVTSPDISSRDSAISRVMEGATSAFLGTVSREVIPGHQTWIDALDVEKGWGVRGQKPQIIRGGSNWQPPTMRGQQKNTARYKEETVEQEVINDSEQRKIERVFNMLLEEYPLENVDLLLGFGSEIARNVIFVRSCILGHDTPREKYNSDSEQFSAFSYAWLVCRKKYIRESDFFYRTDELAKLVSILKALRSLLHTDSGDLSFYTINVGRGRHTQEWSLNKVQNFLLQNYHYSKILGLACAVRDVENLLVTVNELGNAQEWREKQADLARECDKIWRNAQGILEAPRPETF